MKTSRLQRVFDYIIVLVIVIAVSAPIFLVILSSFKTERDVFSRVPKFIFTPNLEAYRWLVQQENFWIGLKNNGIITTFSIFLTLSVALPVAYSYSRFAFKGTRSTAIILLGIRMFPAIIISIPLYPTLVIVGLIDTPIALIMGHVAFQTSMTTLLLKVFIDAIPQDLDDAALIDGCNRFQAFIRVMLPIIAPGLIAAAIFVALASWNDYLFAFLFTEYKARTLPIFISEVMYEVEHAIPPASWPKLFAACTVQMVPMLVFIWAIQKRLLSGFTFGAVKG